VELILTSCEKIAMHTNGIIANDKKELLIATSKLFNNFVLTKKAIYGK